MKFASAMSLSLRLLTKGCLAVLLICSLQTVKAQAQEEQQEKQQEEQKEEVKKEQTSDKFIQSIELQVDYLKAVTFFLDDRMQYEGSLNIRFMKNITLSGDFGFAHWTPQKRYNNTLFDTEGNYVRLGLDYRVKLDEKFELGLGARAARAFYQEKAVFHVESELHEGKINEFVWENLRATWAELVVSSDRKLWKGLHAGLILRYRFLINAPVFEPLDSYAIPGYGKKFNNSLPAANLYLKYRFSF
jgi:hypothetical protein